LIIIPRREISLIKFVLHSLLMQLERRPRGFVVLLIIIIIGSTANLTGVARIVVEVFHELPEVLIFGFLLL
jgi:hypothetical protein